MIIRPPTWFFERNSKEDIERVRERLYKPSRLFIAVEWDDGFFYIARVESVDRRAHVISFSGEGNEYTKVRLIGYNGEKLSKFLFIARLSSAAQDMGSEINLYVVIDHGLN